MLSKQNNQVVIEPGYFFMMKKKIQTPFNIHATGSAFLERNQRKKNLQNWYILTIEMSAEVAQLNYFNYKVEMRATHNDVALKHLEKSCVTLVDNK